MAESDDALKHKFNQETSKISWQELQRFYARGVVIEVGSQQDLIQVAIAMHRDNKAQVEQWLNTGAVSQVDDSRAAAWLAADATLWAVVVAPWVLVQEPPGSPQAQQH